MEITQHPAAESLELRITGRIDATWGEHLGATIENAVRAGAHRIAVSVVGTDGRPAVDIDAFVVLR